MVKLKRLSPDALFIDLLKDPDRKSLPKIVKEVIYLSFIFKRFPRHYFSRYLFKKDRTNIKDYLPSKFLYKIKPFFNDQEIREVLENKLYFGFFYGQVNVPVPKILMYNHNKKFVVGNNGYEINNTAEFLVLLDQLVSKNSLDSLFIKKTYWSFGGDRIYKIFPEQIKSDSDMINDLYSEVIKSGFLFQETVKQHPDLNKLNPSCINTLRIDTFINSDGTVEIISCYIRMSINDLWVDNISSGGCFVSVDLKTGRLKKDGFLDFIIFGSKVLKEHPVTKIPFENFQIPFFSEAKELVIRAAEYLPGLRLVGWDVAIGESGPVLIEGNSDYDIAGNDIADGGYRANPVFRKVLQEVNYL